MQGFNVIEYIVSDTQYEFLIPKYIFVKYQTPVRTLSIQMISEWLQNTRKSLEKR